MAAVVLSGCAREPAQVATPGGPEVIPISVEADSAAAFVSRIGGGIAFDYQPTASPTAARGTCDLIVDGRVTDLRRPNDAERAEALRGGYDNTFVLTVEVGDALDGEAPEAVAIILPTGPGVSFEGLPEMAQGLRVIAGLTADGDGWNAAIDGLWFQGAKDSVMHGPYAEPWELAEPWNGADTLDEYAAAIRTA